MTTKITREVIESFVDCRYKGYLKLAGEYGSPSDYEQLMRETRARVRLAATAKLEAQHEEDQVLQRLTLTLGVLKRGVQFLLDVTVKNEEFCLCFDALQRATGSSRLGDFHYVPVLFHEAERPVRKLSARLELLGQILGSVQGRQPDWGILIYGRNCEIKKVKLRPNGQQTKRVMEAIKELRERKTPPRLTLNRHCLVCEFRHRCHAEAMAKDDLSLLRSVGEKDIERYERKGIFTVTQLSYTFRLRQKGKRQRQQKQPHYPALKALAIRDKKIYVLGTLDLLVCPVRIYFDIEGDPDRRFDYLLGLIVETNGAEERLSFWADTPEEEQRVFQQFLDIVGRHPDCRLYAYGNYEAVFLRRMVKKSGRPELSEHLLPRLVNLLSVIHSHVYFPTYSNGLKDIAGYLGFGWTAAEASGIQSIVWRRRWEETPSDAVKNVLTTYNLEDCAALQKVTQYLYALCSGQPTMKGAVGHEEPEISRVEETALQSRMRGWNQAIYAVPDFGYINDRAYFDYQRERVFMRTTQAGRKSQRRHQSRQGKKDTRANRHIALSSQECPTCGGTALTRRPHGNLARLAFDLRITRNGIKRWVTRFTTSWHHCTGCGTRFLPGDYLGLQEFGHSLKSWAMYEYVAHRISLTNIADTIRQCFAMPLDGSKISAFKRLLAWYYEGTYKRLLEKLVAGNLIHGDETEVNVRKVGKAYIWVFTNLEEVVFLYRSSREGKFLHDLLKDFKGVFVSDFYTAYDSLHCAQQKCLIHLLRDFNKDLLTNPWDEELKSIASDFGGLLRKIVATIDRYGLKQRHLAKHRRDVEKFFRTLISKTYRSGVAESYQKRLLRYRDRLFTFLDHDDVPWNNNSAEHAVKAFAYYREAAGSLITEVGLNQYLVLLSIYQTCKYKGVSFLEFLLSREADIDVFRQRGSRRRPVPDIELYPEDCLLPRPSHGRGRITGSIESQDSTGKGHNEAVTYSLSE